MSTISLPRPSRSPSARRTSCRAWIFSNDPLLQGRNFSYLDTQLKRLGGPNFTHIPINAPKCPVHHFQQDGHMAMTNPKGRANYEPNSWTGRWTTIASRADPRACPMNGFTSFPAPVDGPKMRVRSETFADHYSQARQFYVSQTKIEQGHMANALTFELQQGRAMSISASGWSAICATSTRVWRRKSPTGSACRTCPTGCPPHASRSPTCRPARRCRSWPTAPDTFKGRKLGIYIAEGADAATVKALMDGVKGAGGMVEIVAPHVGGAKLSDGKMMAAQTRRSMAGRRWCMTRWRS